MTSSDSIPLDDSAAPRVSSTSETTPRNSRLPLIIQGGMGAGISSWRLAQAVSRLGQLGVVSGTALDQILVRRLQDGDPGGNMRRAIDHFPFSVMAEKVWQKFYIPGGKAASDSYKPAPPLVYEDSRESQELIILANYVEIFLARENHTNPVGINYLEKIQIPHLPSIYGAMLAGVSFILMGAGVPLKIPVVLDQFATHQTASYSLHVTGALDSDDTAMIFSPREFMEVDLGPLARPQFLAIISSNVLAATLIKRANSRVDGFIVEGPTAGGHNAPPRGKLQLDEKGEPVYGERDIVDLAKLRELGLPFWLAGGYGSPEKLREALAHGAAGVQVGTAFEFCEESDLRTDYKRALIQKVVTGEATVFTDSQASPTSFPFKVAQLEGSLSEQEVYKARPRICDLGYLREPYKTPDGTVDFRCAAEPVSLYLSKGGKLENTVGRKCLCNALLSNIDQSQVRAHKYVESGTVTSGDDLPSIGRFFRPGATTYNASDVITELLRS